MGIIHKGKGYYTFLKRLYHGTYQHKRKANRVYIYSYIEINDIWIPVYAAKPKNKHPYARSVQVAKYYRDLKLKGVDKQC